MRIPLLSLAILILGISPASSQSKPGPIGLHEARQYESKHPLEAPQPPTRKIDLAELQREADELSTLAQTIPADVRSTTQGLLSKDLLEKLKRIEKLSKRLRSQLSP
jgi:hypothetical protein